jgi:hypothetical protein
VTTVMPLRETLAPGASSGILEVVTGKASLADVVWTDPSTGLTFLPAVVENDFAHTSELLGSDSMRKLFISLREQYDYVVVDNSPLSPVGDVRSTTQFVDTNVMVVEWGQTKLDTVKYALSAAPSIYEAMLGVVPTKLTCGYFVDTTVVATTITAVVSRFRSSYAHFACVSSVRRQKRSMDARMSPADFVQRNGLGAAFLILI